MVQGHFKASTASIWHDAGLLLFILTLSLFVLETSNKSQDNSPPLAGLAFFVFCLTSFFFFCFSLIYTLLPHWWF